MNKAKIRVAIFQSYIPHYRLCIFRKLQGYDDLEFVICASKKLSDSFKKTEQEEISFPVIDIATYQLKLPFTKHSFIFRPLELWGVITGKYDVYIIPDNILDVSLWSSLILAIILRRRICLWGQGISRPPRSLSWFLRSILYKFARAVIFYSETAKNEWIKGGIRAKNLFVAYNSVDNETMCRIRHEVIKAEDLKVFQQNNGLKNKKLVIFSGRLQRRKNTQILVHAMKEVVAAIPDAYLVIIGDGPLRGQLKKLSEDIGMADYMTFTGAIYDEKELGKYFLSAKVAVIPAAAGLGIQHAFAYGIPIIIGDDMSNHGPETELIIDGETGIYCKDGEPSDFARVICELLTDESMRKRMSENASRMIEQKYNVKNMAKGFVDAVRHSMNN